MAFIALHPEANLTSEKIAESVQTNPACGVGVNIQLVLRDCYRDIQHTVENRMREITLRDVLEQYRIRVEGGESCHITKGKPSCFCHTKRVSLCLRNSKIASRDQLSPPRVGEG